MRSGRTSAVVVFARSVEEERRAKPLFALAGPEAASRLHGVLLARTLRAASAMPDASVYLSTSGAAASGSAPRERAERVNDWRGGLADDRLFRVEQVGESFGERLRNAVAVAFADGHERVLVVGTDTPELDASRIRRAFTSLEEHGSVIGFSVDGGFYLLGLSRFDHAIFDRVPYGTAHAAAGLRKALHEAGFDVAALDTLHDLDDRASLAELVRRLRTDRGDGLVACLLEVAASVRGQPLHGAELVDRLVTVAGAPRPGVKRLAA
jgi:rSAM/selenodomain-associated transferase 1